MSIREVEAIYEQIKELSDLDRMTLRDYMADMVGGCCSVCEVESPAVCDGCYDEAFNDGVDEAANRAEDAKRRQSAIQVVK